MTEDQLDEAHALKEEVSDAIVTLVRSMLSGRDVEVADWVKEDLEENFRFWRY